MEYPNNNEFKNLFYLVDCEIPTVEELFNVEYNHEGNLKYYNNIKFIKLEKEEEIFEDIVYRSLNLYSEYYFIKIKDEYFMKSKKCSFSRYAKIKNYEVIEYISDIVDIFKELKGELDSYFSEEYKYTENDYTIPIFYVDNIILPRKYEDLFKLFKINNKNELIKIAHEIDHTNTNWYLYMDQDIIESRNIMFRFDEVKVFTNNLISLEIIIQNLRLLNL